MVIKPAFHNPGTYANFTFIGELGRIPEEIYQDLPQFVRIRIEENVIPNIHIQGQAFLLHKGHDGVGNTRHKFLELNLAYGQFFCPGLDPGEVQDVVYQLQEVFPVSCNNLDIFFLFFINPPGNPFSHEVCQAKYRI